MTKISGLTLDKDYLEITTKTKIQALIPLNKKASKVLLSKTFGGVEERVSYWGDVDTTVILVVPSEVSKSGDTEKWGLNVNFTPYHVAVSGNGGRSSVRDFKQATGYDVDLWLKDPIVKKSVDLTESVKVTEAVSKEDIMQKIKKVSKNKSKDIFTLTKDQIEKFGKEYNLDTEDIYQYGDKLPNGDWEFESIHTVANGILKNRRESASNSSSLSSFWESTGSAKDFFDKDEKDIIKDSYTKLSKEQFIEDASGDFLWMTLYTQSPTSRTDWKAGKVQMSQSLLSSKSGQSLIEVSLTQKDFEFIVDHMSQSKIVYSIFNPKTKWLLKWQTK